MSLGGTVVRRILVTLAALLAYRLASFVPIPGIDTGALAHAGFEAIERLSMMALGVVPWLSAATLAEIAVLVLPNGTRLPFARDLHADPFSLWVVVGALVIAAFQAYGIVLALRAMPQIVPDASMAFHLGAVASFVAGTALVILLAGIISRIGIGRGFWVLIAGAALFEVGRYAIQLVAAWQQGVVSATTALVLVAGTVVAAAAVAALVLAQRNINCDRAEPLVWPIFIYAAVSPWIAVVAEIAASPFTSEATVHTHLMPQRPLGALLAFVLLFLIAVRYGRRSMNVSLALPTALVLFAIQTAAVSAPALTGFFAPSAGPFVVLATVVTVALLDDGKARTLEASE